METTKRLAVAVALGLVAACSAGEEPDAYGNVEAIELVVSAEVTGPLTTFTVQEGQVLEAGADVGVIDPAPLSLERSQLSAERAATASRGDEIAGQIQALRAQQAAAEAQHAAAEAQAASIRTALATARRAFERTERLFAQQAATAQQRDQADRDFHMLEDQLRAQDEQVTAQARQVEAQSAQIVAAQAQRATVRAQVVVADTRVARVEDRLGRSRISNPASGTVLVTYVRAGEIVQAGQPLYRIANLDDVDVRAYVTQPQLAGIQIGQEVTVTLDRGPDRREAVTGTIAWISDRAEFTPTPVQTRDERADLVYAIKVRVANGAGLLKIGMPVDVQFTRSDITP